jgi:hypothetical protein
MGFLSLNTASPLYCQDINCQEQFPDRDALVPKMGSASGKFKGKAFIVVRCLAYNDLPYCNVGAITSVQCDRTNIHSDQRAWFGLWPLGVLPTPLRPNPSVRSTAVSNFIVPVSITPWKQRERCTITDCRGFTAMGCPYHRCAGHCRTAGGCSKHKVPIAAPQGPPSSQPPFLSRPAESNIGEYQDAGITEEDALNAALEASRSETPGDSSSAPADPLCNAPLPSRRPKISSQLGGAWLKVIDADAADELQKETVRLAKAEAALEAKKTVDVMWYDQVGFAYLTSRLLIVTYTPRISLPSSYLHSRARRSYPNTRDSMPAITWTSLVLASLASSTILLCEVDGFVLG